MVARESGGRHFAFAGHLDVVPPGAGWASDPFVPQIKGDLLHGRGAVDMKGSIAAFVAALKKDLPKNIRVVERDTHIEDPVFAIEAAQMLIEMIRAKG